MTTGQIDQEPAPIPKSIRVNFQVDVSEMNGRNIWQITPKHKSLEQVVLYLHGGSYIYNMSKEYWQLVEQLSFKTGATFIVPDYPLAPQAQWQDAYPFIEAVYEQLLARMLPENVILLGDSAGGGLALGFAQWLRNEGRALPRQIILLAPFLDITMSNPDIPSLDSKDKILSISGLQLAGAAFAGDLDHKDYRVSPVYGALEGLPPISLFIGTDDLLWADARKLKERMRAENRPFNYFEYPGMIHDWVVVAQLPEAQHAIDQVSKLIKGEL